MTTQTAQPAAPVTFTEITLSAALIAATITGKLTRAFRRRYTRAHSRVTTWWGALSRARDYSKNRAKHKFKRGEKTVTHHDRVRDYNQPVRPRRIQRPKVVVRETGMFTQRLWDDTDVQLRPVPRPQPPVDELWVRRIRAEFNNASLLMTGAEGPLHHVYDPRHRPASIPEPDAARTAHVGHDTHPDGEDDRRAEPVRADEGRRDHHGHAGPDRRRGLQRSSPWLCAREPAVHDLVSEDELFAWACA